MKAIDKTHLATVDGMAIMRSVDGRIVNGHDSGLDPLDPWGVAPSAVKFTVNCTRDDAIFILSVVFAGRIPA